MASRVWISEFTAGGRQQAQAPFASLPAVTNQMFDVTGGRQTSAPFSKTTRYIRVTCEVQCAIRIPAPAAPTDLVMPPLRPEYFGVSPGDTLSAILAP